MRLKSNIKKGSKINWQAVMTFFFFKVFKTAIFALSIWNR